MKIKLQNVFIAIVFFAMIFMLGISAKAQTITIGTGTGTNTNMTYPTPYGSYYGGTRSQFLILASEINAAGGSAGGAAAHAGQLTRA